MKFLSKACEYGIRGVLHVATVGREEQYLPVREVAGYLNISYHFLAKIVQTLIQEGILNSYRGPNGGVSLARPADEITLMDIIEAIDGGDFFHECVLGLPGCGEMKPCPLHNWWKGIREEFVASFSETTVAQLGDSTIKDRLRLAA
ncbi:MAG: Rrf2 family transcriptional regulator [Ignavibacteriae bacterium]|nr:Rrf2 family transcriptional regulator [Ignavibacteriota bacterium]MCB9215759.1 Rrf2 family transcriptional regulator [Ignavibacteria bacterium]